MYCVSVPTVVDNGHFNREKTLAELKRAGAHRVALALTRDVDAAFSTPENLALLKELITYFENNGLETIVWLGETLGHAASGVKFYEQYGHIRHLDGKEIASFCPTDPVFTGDFVNWVKNTAKAGGKMIMLDDDFRLGYRGGIGCACDRHMAMVAKNLGRPVTREEILEKAFSGGKNPVRDAWMKAQGDSLREFCRAMRKGLDEVNPKARLSYCTCLDSWDTSDTDPEELSKIMAGSTRPFIRLIGAPYWAADGFRGITLGDVIEYQRNEKHWIKDPDIEVFSEGDSYPRPRNMVPAAFLEGYDSALRADGTLDGILKYMLDYVSNADYETGYVDAMVEHLPLYEKIEGHFPKAKAVGVRPYNVLHLLKDAELDGSRPDLQTEIQNGIQAPSIHFAVRNSLPISYEENQPLILFGENARHVRKEELSHGAIVDYPAVKILLERGIDPGIVFEKAGGEEHTAASFTDVPSEYAIGEQTYFRLNGSVKTESYRLGEKGEVLTQYRVGDQIKPGWAKTESRDGLRFVVVPFNMLDAAQDGGWMGGYAHRRILLSVLPWLKGEELDAVTLGNHPMLYEMVRKDRDSLAVGCWNFYQDKIKGLEIALKDGWNRVEFINCSGRLEGKKVIIDSVLYPFEFAGAVLKK